MIYRAPVSLLSVVVVTGLLTATSVAQGPPDINRWSSSTANAPAQGYGMGNPLLLTWGFLRNGTTTNGGGASNLISSFDATFGAGPGGADLTQRPWFTSFQQSFTRWSQVSGLSYLYEANDDGVNQTGGNIGINGTRADLRIGGRNIDGPGGTLAFNNFPTNGDMVIDTGDMGNYGQAANNFRFLRNVIMHEHGHGMGCPHCESNSTGFLMEPFIQTGFDGPQYHDILLAQRGYGDVLEKTNANLGNDTAARATALGLINNGGMVSIGNDARNLAVGANEVDFVSIDDQSDTDFFSFSLANAAAVTISLEALGQTYNVGAQGGTQISFNTATRSNLGLALFDTNGTTMLAQSNSTGFGGNELINFNIAGAGTYFIRVTGADNTDAFFDTQFYGLSVNAVPEPATMAVLGLAAAAVVRRRRRSA